MTNPGSSPVLPPESLWERLRAALIGAPRDVRDPHIGHKMSLIAFLAWVGLGVDGLSSSAYGPEEAYRALGEHTALAIFLVVATAATVGIISFAYSKIIEHFPQGGGGYLVATKLLGSWAGVTSGCALLVDYVLTITVSIAGGAAAVFSLLPVSAQRFMVPTELAAIVVLIVLNLRGVKESVTALIPIFITFIVTHAVLILGGIAAHLGQLPAVASHTASGLSGGAAQIGAWGMFLVFLRAYSMGGGTYTGIEAVSNGMAILREPRIETGKRTMFYMAVSLALTAGGLLLCYMLLQVSPREGQTLNAVLARAFAGSWRPLGIPIGTAFVFITLMSESVLLLFAAQTGFIDGPRVMANMSLDGWMPRRFAALSDRLAMQNGILLMGGAAMALLLLTHGHITTLIVMYSINVFITFTLSHLGMIRLLRRGAGLANRRRDLATFLVGLALCASILIVMLVEKLREGGWMTVLITSACVGACVLIRRHYRQLADRMREIDATFANLPKLLNASASLPPYDANAPTAAILVGGYGGLGIHILLTVMRLFPKTFQNVVFLSVGVVDSGYFREGENYSALEQRTRETLERYVALANKIGLPAKYVMRVGTDVVGEASTLCSQVAREHARAVFFAGSLAFDKPRWYDRILHNETAYAIQRQIKSEGLAMLILPMLVNRTALWAEAVTTAAAK